MGGSDLETKNVELYNCLVYFHLVHGDATMAMHDPWELYVLVLCFASDVVEVSLEVASASVSESNGSVEVCVAVVSGQLSRDVELNLFTQSGTATCKYSLH